MTKFAAPLDELLMTTPITIIHLWMDYQLSCQQQILQTQTAHILLNKMQLSLERRVWWST